MNLFNEPASYALRQILEQKFSYISTFPKAGSSVASLIGDVAKEFLHVRKTNAKNYTLAYHHDDENNTVLITHIFHQTHHCCISHKIA